MADGTTALALLSNADIIVGRISELQTALQTAAPTYESLLHTIHVSLAKDPDVVHLLTEEQIGVICSGLSKKTGVVIADMEKKSSRGKTANGKKLNAVSLDDI